MYLDNCLIIRGNAILKDCSVLVEGGIVRSIGPRELQKKGIPITDLQGGYLLPGLLDTQIYGGDGLLFSENLNEASLERIETYLIGTGSTGFLITIPTRPFADIEKAIEVVARYLPHSKGALLGLHVEGPYMHPAKKGAHREEWLKRPAPHEIDLLVEAGKAGVVRMITLAPEMVTASDIQQLAQSGIVVSAGHSNGTYEQFVAGFKAGIQHVTHAFNAMPQIEGRKPGLLAAAADTPGIMVSIIADGQHVHFPSFRVAKKILGKRLYCITDAVTKTAHLHLKNGAFYNDENILTGSAMTMASSIRNCTQEIGLTVLESVRMASAYPAKVLGLEKTRGDIQVGLRADFTVVDSDWKVQKVMLNGVFQ